MSIPIFLKKLYQTEEQKKVWRLWGVSLLFLHVIFLPEIFALPACISYRDPVHLYRQNLALLLLLSALPLLTGKWGGRVVFFFYALWGFFNGVVLFSLVKFHMALDYTTLQILAITDPSEVQEFCDSFLRWYDFITFAVVIAVMAWSMKYTLRVSTFSRRLGLCLLIPFFLAALPSVCKGKVAWFGKRNALCRFVLNSITQYSGEMKQLHMAALRPILPKGVHYIGGENGGETILGVVVVGESARRANFQCYGYKRPTTPNLTAFSDQCLFFDDVISPSTSTLRCCVYEFTDATIGNSLQMRYSICNLLTAGGYQVALYSNQRRSGQNESLGMLFNQAHEKRYLMEDGNKDYDLSLYSCLKDSPLAMSSKPTIVFLHTMGSHRHAQKRYPSDWEYFEEDFRDEYNSDMDKSCAEYVNFYDNSIRLADELLGNVMVYLNSLSRPAFLLYLSDHAEILFSEDDETNFRDAMNRQAYEIPFIVFTNKAYRDAYPDFMRGMAANVHQPMQADSTLYAIASLARLTCDGFPNSRDITSPAYVPVERYMGESVQKPYVERERAETSGTDNLLRNQQ